ncbi:Ig-like domain-containing protein [Anaerotaenia torta]|uniref:Ig-like domain-containing protein n=1 Tax=Anaerotaenia torta TaxID=433293 RepID=UPI003D2489AF
MKKNFFCKCFITLGLFLFLTLLLPFTSFNTLTAQATVVEKEKPESCRLNLKSVTLVKGKSFPLKVYNLGENSKVSFKSDDAEVASVSDDGMITANKVGSTVITVTIKDGIDRPPFTCDVTVGPAAISVKWTKERVFVALNNDDVLKVILKPDNTTEVARFSSRDSSIATVSSGGRISAKKIGMTYLFAEIDATDQSGARKYASCTVFITSSRDISLLEGYFNNHSELNRISGSELNQALDEFFNGGKAEAAVTPDGAADSVLITELDKFLEEKFKLSEIRAKIQAEMDAALSKTANTETNSVSPVK